MRTLFKSQDLWDLVETGLAEISDEDGRSKENQKPTSFNEAWTTLKTEFQGFSKVITVKLQSLRRDFETSYMKDNVSVQEYLARVFSIVNQMRSYGEKVTDETVVAKVLRSLDPKFDHVVAAIEESKDLSVFSFDELMGSLQAHEVRINRSTVREEEKAFQIKREPESSNMRSRGRGRGGFGGRGRDRNTSLHYSHCNKYGHSDKFCWSKPEEAKYAEEEEEENYLFMTQADSKECVKDICQMRSYGEKVTDETVVAKVLRSLDPKFDHVVAAIKESKDLSVFSFDELWGLCKPMKCESTDQLFEKKKRIFKSRGSRNLLICVQEDVKEAVLEVVVETEILLFIVRIATNMDILISFVGPNPRRQKQNGVAERKNQTVVEMARSMMKEKALPDVFWAEGVATAVYLHNISPTKPFGTKHHTKYGPEVSLQLAICGLYDPLSKTFIVSRNVIFDEAASWNWSKKENEQTTELDFEEQGESMNNSRKLPASSQEMTCPESSLNSTPMEGIPI
nr:UBN2 domain-containing protein [Tanacetum cinerariifolium]